jgi:putative zinc finger/helix-turn-helix YgiT family protein
MKATKCPVCHSNAVTTALEADNFVFRSGGVDYAVSAELPVHTCTDCGETFISEIGEIARHAAVCHAMRRLTPEEIYALRHDRLNLSRKAFAELSGIGEASLARWEGGEIIQSESNDNLLRLLSSPENVRALKELRGPDQPRSGLGPRPPREGTDARTMEAPALDAQRFPALRDSDAERLLTQRDRFRLTLTN